MSAVDVLAVMDGGAEKIRFLAEKTGISHPATDLVEASAAVAELIEADRGYDAAKSGRIKADNRITAGDRSDDAFRSQANAHHAYDRAVARRSAALARVGGAA